MRHDAARDGAIGLRRSRAEGLGSAEGRGQEIDPIELRPGLQLARAGQRLLDGEDLVLEAQVVELPQIGRRDEGDRRAGAARAAGASRAMHVRLVRVGEVVVHHVGEVRDVDAARRDVGGHQVPQLAAPGPREHGLALVLGQVTVQPVGVVAGGLQLLGDLFGGDLGVAEDDRALGVLHLEDAHQLAGLGAAGDDVHEVLEGLGAHLVAREGDGGRLL